MVFTRRPLRFNRLQLPPDRFSHHNEEVRDGGNARAFSTIRNLFSVRPTIITRRSFSAVLFFRNYLFFNCGFYVCFVSNFHTRPFYARLRTVNRGTRAARNRNNPSRRQVRRGPNRQVRRTDNSERTSRIMSGHLRGILPGNTRNHNQGTSHHNSLHRIKQGGHSLLRISHGITPLPRNGTRVNLHRRHAIISTIPSRYSATAVTTGSFIVEGLRGLSMRGCILSVRVLPLARGKRLGVEVGRRTVCAR